MEGLARVVLEVGFQANHRQTLSRRVQSRPARQNTARPQADDALVVVCMSALCSEYGWRYSLIGDCVWRAWIVEDCLLILVSVPFLLS
jgi:hypothetical protein